MIIISGIEQREMKKLVLKKISTIEISTTIKYIKIGKKRNSYFVDKNAGISKT